MRQILLPILPLVAGCTFFAEYRAIKDRVDGLLNPLMAQGMVVSVDEPEIEVVQLIMEAADYDAGTAVTVFLADAEDAVDAEEAPVQGASVWVDEIPAYEGDEGGMYTIEPNLGIPYEVGANWDVEIDRFRDGTEISAISVELPPVAVVDLPDVHDLATPLIVDLSGQGFTAVLVLVMSDTGVITYSSKPETVEDLLYFTKGTIEMSSYEIPGEAFPAPGAYAIGVAGMDHSDASSIVNLNTFASSMMAGKMPFGAVVVP